MQRLPVSKLDDVSIGVPHHSKVAHYPADILRRFNQNVLLPRLFGNAIYLGAAVTLKPEVIQTGFHFFLDDHQNKDWIFSRFGGRPEPDIVPAFETAVTHDRKAAERIVEIDRSVDVAAVYRDVRPKSCHLIFPRSEFKLQVAACLRKPRLEPERLNDY